jgi:hypothetical protein
MDIKLHVCNRTFRVMMFKTEEEERDITCYLESKFLTFLTFLAQNPSFCPSNASAKC